MSNGKRERKGQRMEGRKDGMTDLGDKKERVKTEIRQVRDRTKGRQAYTTEH